MKHQLTRLPHSEAEISVTIPFSEFESHLASAARVISERVEISGFRPGKAPYDVVKSRVGEMAIYEEAADRAVRKTFPEILRTRAADSTEGISPIGKPEIVVTKLALGNDLEYTAKIALFPRVELSDYKAAARRIKEEKKDVLVNEEEVAQAIEWIRESRAPFVLANRPAQTGDRAEIDFSVREKGVPLEGGDAKKHSFVIGHKNFLPGFDEALVGMRPGDEKTFALAPPDDWGERRFAGKTLDVFVAMRTVYERQIPELNDDFAKSLGNFPSVDAFRASVKEGLRAEKKEKEKERIRMRMIEEIAKDISVDIPEVLIRAELDTMIAELSSGVAGMGMKWEDYLIHVKKIEGDLRKEWRTDAEKRVRIALALREIARREGVEPSEEEVAAAANDILKRYGSPEDATKSIDPERLKEYTRGRVRNEKVFEFLELV